MKKLFCIAAAILVSSSVFGAEPLKINVKAESSKVMKADIAYITFLADGQGSTMAEALKNCNNKIGRFTGEVKKKFKDAEIRIITINAGTKNFRNSDFDRTKIEPDVTKLILVTIPANEDHAIEILDLGISMEINPYCSIDEDAGYGAIFYGMKDFAVEEDKVKEEAYRNLWKKAGETAAMNKQKIVRLNSSYEGVPSGVMLGGLRAIRYHFKLPVKFHSSDIDNVTITIQVNAEFEVTTIK